MLLQKQVELIAADKDEANKIDEKKKQEEDKKMTRHLEKCETQISAVKDAMNNILSVTKETHNEVQRTKDMISSIQNESISQKINGSFQSRFIEEYDEGPMFEGEDIEDHEEYEENHKNPDNPGEEECVSNPILLYNNKDYVITTEDAGEDDDAGSQWKSLKYRFLGKMLREKLKFYEKKVLQVEAERLEKEKENLQLKESIMQLRSRVAGRASESSEIYTPGRSPVKFQNKFLKKYQKAATCGICSARSLGCNIF